MPESAASHIPDNSTRNIAKRVGSAGLIVLFLVLLFLLLLPVDREAPKPKNVIIVFVDTLNRSALRAYAPSAPELPNIDRFSREAVVYDDALSTASWTLQAYATMLTGLFPHHHGVVHFKQGMRDDVATLPELLNRAGYETVAFTDSGFTSAVYGFERGFDRYNAWSDPASGRTPVEVPRGGEGESAPGEHLFDRGLAYLRAQAGRQPSGPGFFLVMHTYSVHNYWKMQPWLLDRSSQSRPEPSMYYFDCLNGVQKCSDEDWDFLREIYQRGLHHLDEGFGRLLATLEETGLRESTLIVLLSDHGEGFTPETSRLHHGGRLHQDLVRIPLMMAGPGIGPQRVNAPVSLVDLLPTILDLLNVPPPEGIDGVSIAPPSLVETLRAERTLFAAEYAHFWEKGRRRIVTRVPKEPLSLAIIRGGKWYIRDRLGEELYDMRSDPLQTHNLAANSPEIETFRVEADWPQFTIPRAPIVGLSEEHDEKLRSLGYLN